jgi:hypothetical protein
MGNGPALSAYLGEEMALPQSSKYVDDKQNDNNLCMLPPEYWLAFHESQRYKPENARANFLKGIADDDDSGGGVDDPASGDLDNTKKTGKYTVKPCWLLAGAPLPKDEAPPLKRFSAKKKSIVYCIRCCCLSSFMGFCFSF